MIIKGDLQIKKYVVRTKGMTAGLVFSRKLNYYCSSNRVFFDYCFRIIPSYTFRKYYRSLLVDI